MLYNRILFNVYIFERRLYMIHKKLTEYEIEKITNLINGMSEEEISVVISVLDKRYSKEIINHDQNKQKKFQTEE